MLDQVRNILSEYTEVSLIMPESVLTTDLDLSSFDLAAIVTEFEEVFGIEISDRDMERFICVGDILEYLQEHISIKE